MFDELILNDIPNRITNCSNDRFALAHEQEVFLRNKFIETYKTRPELKWMLTEELFDNINNELNRVIGDIICLDTNKHKIVGCFDLKVQAKNSNKEELNGTIMINSFVGFGYNCNNHYYIMTNEDGTNIQIIPTNSIQELIKRGDKFINKTKFKRNIYTNNCYNWLTKFYTEQTNDVAENDYIPSFYVKEFNIYHN